jgi:exodeoxyribonuclease V alpha subunit
VINAHRINEGKLPYIHTKPSDDFQFIETQNAMECLSAIVSLLTDKLKGTKIDPIEDVQVLSPMKKGVAGIESLNKALQNALNPNGQIVSIGQRTFRIHDKVMQTKNNYDTRVFNGEMGRICEINPQEEVVTINFDGKIIECDYKQMDEIVLAYAVSIHKYQGSECPHIIIPVDTSHFKLLGKNLLYTGITRGKKSVVVVGSKKALAMAVHNDNVSLRHTGLTYFLQKEATQKKKQMPF